MKTNLQRTLLGFIILFFIIFSSLFLTNCKGKAEIYDIVDSVENCSPPFVVYFFPDAEHRTKKLEYTWDFGDGEISHDQKPVHVYSEYGSYQVNLNIRQNKASDDFTYVLHLTEDATKPFADWDYASRSDSLWAPAYVEFQNYSEYASIFLWDFGDGDTSNSESPIHIYETQGTYNCILNAICIDTAKLAKNMVIKPPPTDILIDEVTVWMPNSFIGTDVWVRVWYAGHEEDESALAQAVSSFPVTFPLTHNVYWFDGVYNSDLLEFELWSSVNDGDPEKIFGVESRDLQLEYYPTLIGREDGYGFAFEAKLQYRQ